MIKSLIFIRKEGFYEICINTNDEPNKDMKQIAKDHAECNLGTLRVEDIRGNILWDAYNDK